jgi:outer membrane protein insertion porin family
MAGIRAVVAILAVLLAAAASVRPALAQIPYTVFDARTQVRSIGFRFLDGNRIAKSRLEEQLVLSDRGRLAGLREKLAFLPLISAPGPAPFSPIELQRDVARLRDFYSEAGFIETAISYEVEYDEADNEVSIQFVIDEGRPITLESIAVRLAAGVAADTAVEALLPESLHGEWRRFVEDRGDVVGGRMTDAERVRQVTDVVNFFLNRGYAFARGEAEVNVDSAAAQAHLTVRIEPGPRARVESIDIVGAESVSERVVRRALPLAVGDWFSAERLAEGQRRVFALDLFRLALTDVPDSQPRDSTVDIRVRLEESPPRLVTGEIGYAASGGIATRAEFAHRNFLGGARTLRLTGQAETGVAAVVDEPERIYGASLTYRQPYLFHPRLSFTIGPFGQYRDNLTDRSWQAGIETTFVYELGEYRYVTFQHRYSTRRVLDYRFGPGSSIDLITLLELIATGALDSLGTRIERSTFSLSGTIGRYDPTRSLSALQVRPSIQVTAPAALSTIEYALAELPIVGYLPLSDRVAFTAHARLGRLFPFGKTVRGDSVAGPLQSIQLRDVLLTAGGTGSVRGWGPGLLGPKFPNIELTRVSADSTALVARGYAPAGGLARASASIEMRLPFPGLSEQWGTHVFLDAGRVWTPDDRFEVDDLQDERRWFFGTGAGIDLNTLVGPIKFSVGYKLNPSPLDLRDAADILEALQEERPIESAPTDWKKRWHIHVSLGRGF